MNFTYLVALLGLLVSAVASESNVNVACSIYKFNEAKIPKLPDCLETIKQWGWSKDFGGNIWRESIGAESHTINSCTMKITMATMDGKIFNKGVFADSWAQEAVHAAFDRCINKEGHPGANAQYNKQVRGGEYPVLEIVP